MIHHRTPEFSSELAQLLELMQPVFGTKRPALPVHGTGRSAMEAALVNVCSPGDHVVACVNGRFGEMWAKIADAYDLNVHRVGKDWTRDLDLAEVEEAIDAFKPRVVTSPYGDTSTGVANDVPQLAQLAHRHGVMVLIDGVSSIGGMPFAFDEWDVDVAVTASQKCLMSAPGLSFAVVGERAWSESKTARLPKSYLNLSVINAAVAKRTPEPPGTPPIAIVLQVVEALRMIHEEGLGAFQHRHTEMAAQTRQGLAAMGLHPHCPHLTRTSTTVTPVAAPDGVAPQRIRAGMESRGILVADGQDDLKATGFRIGHMGDIRPADVRRTLDALKDVLHELAVPADT